MMCSQSIAQVSSAGRPSLSLGAEVGIPVGDLNKSQNTGFGGSLKGIFPLFEGGALTLSAGYIGFSKDERSIAPALNFIPLKAGLRYNLSPGGVYLEPQLGYTSTSAKNSNIPNSGGFTYAAALGTMVQALDLSVRYEGVSRNGTTLPFIGVRGAYNFKL
jgi:hypothetical protein